MRLRRMGNERNYLLRTVIPTSRDWPHEPARSLHFGRDDNCLYQSLGRDDSSLHRSQGILGFNEVLAVKVSRITIIFLSLLFAFAAAAQTPPPDASLTENPAYQKNCAKCHGKTAEGRHFGGPPLVAEAARGMSADDLRSIITNGKHRMPKYAGKLTPEEINTLVDQIRNPPKK